MVGDDLSRLRLAPHERAAGNGPRWGLYVAGAALVAVVAVVSVLVGRGRGADTEAERDAADPDAPVIAAAPEELASARQLAAGGYVEARRRAMLYPGRDGVVERVHVRLGEQVRRGDLLLQLDTAIAGAEVAGAHADVASARAELDDARVALRRLEQLAQTGSVPEEQVDQARYRVSAQAARVEALEARERLAAARLGLSFLRAPFDGAIVRVDLEPGEVVSLFGVQSGSGGIEIADLTEIWVRVDVPETRIAGVMLGDPAEVVVDALGERRLQAVVVEIAPVADRQSNTVEVAVRVLDPPALLRPDLSARVTILPRGVSERE